VTLFWAIDYACLAAILAGAVAVVRIENLNGAVMALSATGTILGLLFVVLGAPDDAHAEVVVGTIALPTLYLVAIGKVRAACGDPGEAAELGEEPAGGGSA
jgi:energy-converting hydrogenase B subunit D